jgi:hypothetical protein
LAFSNRPASGIVLRRNARLGQGVEQGGFTDVGQADDAALQTHKISFGINPLCTIEPNVGIVEVPNPSGINTEGENRPGQAESQLFVLVLPEKLCQLY